MEDTYRPPYFHMNTMSEFAFLVEGGFDSTPVPKDLHGLCTLTNPMVPHGSDAQSFKAAVSASLQPHKVPPGNLGVMFESR